MTEYTALTAADPPPDIPPEIPPADPEQRPRAVGSAAKPGTGIARRIRNRGQGGASKSRAKPKKKLHERVSIEHLIETGWGIMARICAPVSGPLSRCLEMQAPVAGMVLEDAAKGTFIDTALQPLARAERRVKAVAALTVPPMCVAAAEAAMGLPEGQRQIRLALIEPVLLESLTWWAEVAGDKVVARMEREAERGPARELARRMFRDIFPEAPEGPPPAPAPGPAEQRDQAVNLAQGAVIG